MPTLQIVDNRHKFPIVSMRINGIEHRFLIDTGASHSILDPLLIPGSIESCGKTESHGVSGKTNGTIFPIKFNFCGVCITEVATLVVSNQPINISGLIGQDILQQFSSVTFDNKKNLVIFTR